MAVGDVTEARTVVDRGMSTAAAAVAAASRVTASVVAQGTDRRVDRIRSAGPGTTAEGASATYGGGRPHGEAAKVKDRIVGKG